MLSYVRLCGFMKSEAPSIMDFLCWKLLVNFEKAETQVPARRSHEAVSVSAHCRVRVAGGAWQGPGCMIESVVSGRAVHWPGRLFRCQSLPEGVASPSPALWPQPQPTRQGHGDHLNGFSKPNMLMKFSNVPAPAPPLQQQRRTRKVASEPCPSQAPVLLTDLAHHDIFLVSKLD